MDKTVLPHLRISGEPVYEVNVDGIVAGLPGYQEAVAPYKAELARHRDPRTGRIAISDEEADRIAAETSSIYFPRRKEADNLSNSGFLRQLIRTVNEDAQRSHIVYESTVCAEPAFDWALKVGELAGRLGYTPVVVYPIVRTPDLVERSRNRAALEGRLPERAFIEMCAPSAFENAMKLSGLIQLGIGPFKLMYVVDNTKAQPHIDSIITPKGVAMRKPEPETNAIRPRARL
jgi:hypothetical protein